MAILIDPPAWPAHGTIWSHVISDRSYDELHRFAAGLGLTRRAFDLDHYDVPADRYAAALDAGAAPTGGRDLARRLIASGLRVPGRDRAQLKALRRRWLGLMPDEYEIGDDLLVRWREPHRVYHGPRHLAETLDAAELLRAVDAATPGARTGKAVARAARDARVVELALWFHDAVHTGTAGRDEDASADLAVTVLDDGLSDRTGHDTIRGDTGRVGALVRMTASHDVEPSDRLAAVVSDADLAILAAPPERYALYTRQVRAEYAHVSDAAFREGRAAVLDQLLELPQLYHTSYARRRWRVRAIANLRAELAMLHSSPRE